MPPVVTAAPSTPGPPAIKVWPLLAWNGRNPVISDGWGSPRDGGTRMHKGADVMYRRRWESELLATYPARVPHSKWHFMPAGTLVVAAGDGVIWSAERTARGFAIVVDHGRPWATFYQHLSALLVPIRAAGPGGMRVRAGQPIGIVGADPTNPPGHAIAHLHFEIWRGGDGSSAIDPQPILTRLPVLLAPTVGAPTAPPVRPLDRIYAEHGRGIPVPYLRALAIAESGENVNDPHGVINVVQTALADYNRRHMSAPVSEGDLRQPEVSVKVAADLLRTIIDGYRRFHPVVANLQENWQNPEFVGLLTAGWNAGASEARGVGRVASYIATLGGEVTLANVWKLAKDAGASPHLSNPGKLAFATKVRDAYVAATRAGAPS